MGIGGSIVLLTLATGNPFTKSGAIVGHWYDEALLTGIAQITRGILEAFVPIGPLVNLALDGVGTICNLGAELSNLPYHGDGPRDNAEAAQMIQEGNLRRQQPPYADPQYPTLMSFLYLA